MNDQRPSSLEASITPSSAEAPDSTLFRSRNRWSLHGWMVVVSLVSAVVILVVGVVGGSGLYQLARARADLVDQLDPALLEAQQLALSLVNQETGVRGYAASADPAFLDPYQQGAAQEAAAIAALRRLTAAPVVARSGRTGPVAEAAARWHNQFATPTIEAVRAAGVGNGPPQALGKTLFDAVRGQLDAQRVSLSAARAQARSDVDDAFTRLLWTCVGILAGLVLVLFALAVGTQRTVIVPIAGLARTVRSVAGGRYEHEVGVTEAAAPQEIVSLATDVETMRERIVAELTTLSTLNGRLSTQSARLERSNRDLEQFAYVASHDLQEPLRKVTGFCQLLGERYSDQLDERAGVYIEYAVDGAQRMSALINDLLAFSRVGRGDIDAVPLAAREVVDEALRNLDRPITTSDADIRIGELPEVLGQRSLLVTLFQNLVANALKFRGEQTPSVTVSAEPQDGMWLFRVRDNGIGVDPAYAEKIFVIFQRLHAKSDYPGTGIGLALCRKIVEYHGGQIWLDQPERPGPEGTAAVGTTFAFTLPAATTEAATAATSSVISSSA